MEQTEQTVRYGWYSVKQESSISRISGTVSIYLTPDSKTVEVTEITTTDKPSGKWDDYISRGQVVKYLCSRPAYPMEGRYH